METINRFFKPPKQSFFLFGPRGTGKSTLVRRYFKDAIYLDLLDPEVFRTYSANPERLRERLLASGKSTTVIIDEIQKIPHLLDLVHALIERKTGWRFVLTGSSSRKLKRTGIDLLAGRALLCSLHPFTAAELGKAFSLEDALDHGLLPVVLDSADPNKVLQTYAALYLREEVQMESLVRNIGNFTRFLEAVSFSHASVLNITNIARECQVERKVVEGYISVMEDLLLAYRLPVFSKRAKRAVVSHPKFYLFDAGVYRSLRPKGPLDRPEEIDGHAFEGLVAEHLRAWIDYSGRGFTLHFWRTRSGVEVDFVVYGADGLFAIETKNTARLQPQDLRGLRSFKEDYPQSKAYLLYRGKERLMKNGILCIPCEEFLLALHPDHLIGKNL
jgi:predicted AAA+ superfamily ATPase